jgi:phosphoribosylpyrophosphate synthetase
MYDKASDKNERSVLGIMLRNAQRLSRLINQLLDISKLEAGKMILHAREVEIVLFLREIVSAYESLAASKGIKYFFNSDVQQLKVYVDKEKMEKVVHNLLSNAFKFTKENGEVVLNLRLDGKNCLIVDDMCDTGGTICKVAAALHQAGAKDIFACFSHAVLSGKASDNIINSHLKKVIVTNTIPLGESARALQESGKIEVLSVAKLLASAIKSIHDETSVSSLFI